MSLWSVSLWSVSLWSVSVCLCVSVRLCVCVSVTTRLLPARRHLHVPHSCCAAHHSCSLSGVFLLETNSHILLALHKTQPTKQHTSTAAPSPPNLGFASLPQSPCTALVRDFVVDTISLTSNATSVLSPHVVPTVFSFRCCVVAYWSSPRVVTRGGVCSLTRRASSRKECSRRPFPQQNASCPHVNVQAHWTSSLVSESLAPFLLSLQSGCLVLRFTWELPPCGETRWRVAMCDRHELDRDIAHLARLPYPRQRVRPLVLYSRQVLRHLQRVHSL